MDEFPSPLFLIHAYAEGFFPMADPNTNELLWFRPDPRAILPLDHFHASRSLLKTVRQNVYTVTFNKAFTQVMRGCSERKETWISEDFLRVYTELHKTRYAHSVEVWKGEDLVGGVYGVAIGAAFFAESKFHRTRDASKVALYHLVQRLKAREFQLLEVQFLTPHLQKFGAVEISHTKYQQLLKKALKREAQFV